MLLKGFTYIQVIFGVLWTSLAILVLVIIYRRLLRYLSRGAVSKREYCELYPLEMNPAHGMIPFYFTSERERPVKMELLNGDMEFIREIASFDCKPGGNIVRFDSTALPDGEYFYTLVTDNQKIMKKMYLRNAVA